MSSTISAGTTAGSSLAMAGDTSGSLQLQTNGTTTAVTIDTSQNVGIGTSSPAYKLDVNGSVYTNSGYSLTGDGSYFTPSGLTAIPNYGLGNPATNQVSLSAFAGIPFYTNQVERMRINSSGNLFIGTTTNPVSNDTGIINAVVSSGDGFNLKHTVNGNNMFNLWQTGSTTFTAIGFSKGDSQTLRGTISVSTSAVAYNTTSDYRLKENIVPMVGALETVTKLKPVTYKWKENDSDGQGFIAHELQEVIPDAVTGEKDAVDAEGKPVYQGVDTSFLVATLTAAIQEAHALIIQLQADVAALKGVKV